MFNSNDLKRILNYLTPDNKFYIGYSGGLDSHVLLHALAILMREQNKLAQLHAIHIDHGWSDNAKLWSQHCLSVCENLGVKCDVINVDAKASKGESREAVARAVRYAAFKNYLTSNDYLLTAHQQDDQAETLLLQLLRGAGTKGLASMPILVELETGLHLRPLLQYSRSDLKNYALENNLQWIEDESNFDISFDRNYLRQQVMPIIEQRWPKAHVTIARTAQHLANASLLLTQLAQQDLKNCSGSELETLSVKKLLLLDEPRLQNMLRYWLQQNKLLMPSTIQLQHIISDILLAKVDRIPRIKLGESIITRYRDDLYWLPKPIAELNLPPMVWDLAQRLDIPNVGTLIAEQVMGEGVAANVFVNNQALVDFRRFGERCQPQGRQGSHPLKKLMQEWNIPSWRRKQLPLVYNRQQQLVAVPGFCVCEPFVATQNTVGWRFLFQKN